MSTTQKLKAKSLRELYDIVSRPSKVFKDKTSGLIEAMVKTDTSVITITDPSSGKDVSIVKASVYSFNDVSTKYGLGKILSAGDINLTIDAGNAYDKLTNYNTINNYKDLIGKTDVYKDREVMAPRRGGQVILNSNFELKYAGPLDARTTAETTDSLYNPDWWLADSGGYVYLYRGMPVSIKSTGDIYTYMGPDIEIRSNNPTIANALSTKNWKLINNSPSTIKKESSLSITDNLYTPPYVDTSSLIISACQDSSAPGIAISKDTILIGDHYNRVKPLSEIMMLPGDVYEDYRGLIISHREKDNYWNENIVALQNVNGILELISGKPDPSTGYAEEYAKINIRSEIPNIDLTSVNRNQSATLEITPEKITLEADKEQFGYDWHLMVDNRAGNVIYRGYTGEEGEDSDNYAEFNHILMAPFECTVNMANSTGGGSINLITDTLRLWNRNIKFVKPTANGQTPVYKVDSSTGQGSIVWQQGDAMQSITNNYQGPKFMKVVSNIVKATKKTIQNSTSGRPLYTLTSMANQSFILTAESALYSLQVEINVRYRLILSDNKSSETGGFDAGFGDNQYNNTEYEITPDISMKILDYSINSPDMLKFDEHKDLAHPEYNAPISIPIGFAYSIIPGNKSTLKYKLSFYLFTQKGKALSYSIKPKRGSWDNDNSNINTPAVIEGATTATLDTSVIDASISKPGTGIVDTSTGGLKNRDYSWKYSYDAALAHAHTNSANLGNIYNMSYASVMGLKFEQDMSGNVTDISTADNNDWTQIIEQITTSTDNDSDVIRYGITPEKIKSDNKLSDLSVLVNNSRVDVISVLFYIIADLQKQIKTLQES